MEPPKTVRETRGFIDRPIKPELGNVSLARLRPITLDRFYGRLLSPGGARNGGALSPATVRRIHGIVRRCLAQGVRWGWLGTNPAASASPPRVPATTIQPPTPSELARLLQAAERRDPELATFLMLSATTGARRSELVALRWSDIDLGRSVVTIARGIVVGPDGIVEKDTKTHQVRLAAVDHATSRALTNFREAAAERAVFFGVELDEHGFVFTSDLGETPWFPDSVSRRFRKLARDVGLSGVRLHDLRHNRGDASAHRRHRRQDRGRSAGSPQRRHHAQRLLHFVPEADRQAADVLAHLLDSERK